MNQARGSPTTTEREPTSHNDIPRRRLMQSDYERFGTYLSDDDEEEACLGAFGLSGESSSVNDFTKERSLRRGHCSAQSENLDLSGFDSDFIPGTPSPYLPHAKKRVTNTTSINSNRKKPKLDLNTSGPATNSEIMVPVHSRRQNEQSAGVSSASSRQPGEGLPNGRAVKHSTIALSKLNGKPVDSSKSTIPPNVHCNFIKVQLNPHGSRAEEGRQTLTLRDRYTQGENQGYKQRTEKYDSNKVKNSQISKPNDSSVFTLNTHNTYDNIETPHSDVGRREAPASTSSARPNEIMDRPLDVSRHTLTRPWLSSVQKNQAGSSCNVEEGSLVDERSSESPDPVQQLHQFESDEMFARMLQAEFDNELPHNPIPSRPFSVPDRPTSHSLGRHYISQSAAAAAEGRATRQRAPSPPAHVHQAVSPPRLQVVSPLRRHQHRGRRASLRQPQLSPPHAAPPQPQHSIPRRRSRSAHGATRNRGPQNYDDMDEQLDAMLDDSLFAFDDDFFTVRVTIGGFGSPRRNNRMRWEDEAINIRFPSQLDNVYGMLSPEDRTRPQTRPYRGRTRRPRAGNAFLNNPLADNDDYEALWQLADRLGEARRRGMTKTEINRLPTKVFHSGRVTSTDRNTSTQCHICMCDYETGEKLRILTCFHEFHSGCIDKWLKDNATCPVCRVEVSVG